MQHFVTVLHHPSHPSRRPFVSLRRIGGLLHWRIGRIGGSFYITKGRV